MNRAEITRLVEDFLARGGVIVRVPAGVSGHQYGFRACARAAGRYGLLRRFGLTHMDNEARSLVLSGDLSLAAARAPLVWEAIARRGEASIEDLHRGLTLKRESI